MRRAHMEYRGHGIRGGRFSDGRPPLNWKYVGNGQSCQGFSIPQEHI